jgi:hypothetical protein
VGDGATSVSRPRLRFGPRWAVTVRRPGLNRLDGPSPSHRPRPTLRRYGAHQADCRASAFKKRGHARCSVSEPWPGRILSSPKPLSVDQFGRFGLVARMALVSSVRQATPGVPPGPVARATAPTRPAQAVRVSSPTPVRLLASRPLPSPRQPLPTTRRTDQRRPWGGLTERARKRREPPGGGKRWGLNLSGRRAGPPMCYPRMPRTTLTCPSAWVSCLASWPPLRRASRPGERPTPRARASSNRTISWRSRRRPERELTYHSPFDPHVRSGPLHEDGMSRPERGSEEPPQ